MRSVFITHSLFIQLAKITNCCARHKRSINVAHFDAFSRAAYFFWWFYWQLLQLPNKIKLLKVTRRNKVGKDESFVGLKEVEGLTSIWGNFKVQIMIYDQKLRKFMKENNKFLLNLKHFHQNLSSKPSSLPPQTVISILSVLTFDQKPVLQLCCRCTFASMSFKSHWKKMLPWFINGREEKN